MKSWHYLRKYFLIIFLIIIVFACKNGDGNSNAPNSVKVNEIKIVNDVICSAYPLIKKEVKIKDEGQISGILKEIKSLKPIPTNSAMIKINYGYFELLYQQGTVDKSYLIIYSIYDGVVIIDNNDGRFYKNNNLENKVYKYFL
jgi:hypothetical protein